MLRSCTFFLWAPVSASRIVSVQTWWKWRLLLAAFARGAVPPVTTTTSVHCDPSPENEVCRRIRARVGQEDTDTPPSSWGTTAAVLQMFLTSRAMDIFTAARGHDRLPPIYRPFTIEEEVTFSEEEDVSAEKGRREDARLRVLVHEPSLQRSPLFLLTHLKCTYMGCDGGCSQRASPGLSQSVKRGKVVQSVADSLAQWFLTCRGVFPARVNQWRRAMHDVWVRIRVHASRRRREGGGARGGRGRGICSRAEKSLWMEGSHSFALKFLLSVKCPHVPIVLLPSIHSLSVCVWSDSAVLYYICHPSFHLSQVLPWLLQTHCCLFFEKDSGKRWEGWLSQT